MALRLYNLNSLKRRSAQCWCIASRRSLSVTQAFRMSKEAIDQNAPVKFSTSGASKRMSIIEASSEDDEPWYQQHCILFSLATFMIYFFVLREENDIDAEFSKKLTDRLPHMDDDSKKNVAKFYTDHGLTSPLPSPDKTKA